MENKIKPVKYTKHLCFKCLKEHKHINNYSIYGRGYGSSFDNENTILQLCDECDNKDLNDWFNEEPTYGEYWEDYKYEKI